MNENLSCFTQNSGIARNAKCAAWHASFAVLFPLCACPSGDEVDP